MIKISHQSIVKWLLVFVFFFFKLGNFMSVGKNLDGTIERKDPNHCLMIGKYVMILILQ